MIVRVSQLIAVVTDTLQNTGKDLLFAAKVIAIVVNALNQKGISLEIDTRGIEEQIAAQKILETLQQG